MLRALAFAVPDALISVIARAAGYAARLTNVGSEQAAEGRVRGLLMAPRFGVRRLHIGRGVIVDGVRRVELGERVTLHAGTQISVGQRGFVRIGEGTHVSRGSVLAGSGGITVGSHCAISSGVMIYSVTYDRSRGASLKESPAALRPVVIGDEVHVGANATILPGTSIGDGAVIGAGAVVTRSVEAGTTVVGSPARRLSP